MHHQSLILAAWLGSYFSTVRTELVSGEIFVMPVYQYIEINWYVHNLEWWSIRAVHEAGFWGSASCFLQFPWYTNWRQSISIYIVRIWEISQISNLYERQLSHQYWLSDHAVNWMWSHFWQTFVNSSYFCATSSFKIPDSDTAIFT